MSRFDVQTRPSVHTPLSFARVAVGAPFHDEGHGYDVFGLHPPTLERVLEVCAPLYDRYFRVDSHGIEHVPTEGPAILVANHGGVLPVDAAMLCFDVLRKLTQRIPRAVADHFVPRLPVVSTLFARCGAVSGTRLNVARLLERGELVAIWPEGVTGPAKRFRDRYRIQAWRVGFAELAIRYRAPIVPVAILGAEESWPLAAKLGLALVRCAVPADPRVAVAAPRALSHPVRRADLYLDHAAADAERSCDRGCRRGASAECRREPARAICGSPAEECFDERDGHRLDRATRDRDRRGACSPNPTSISCSQSAAKALSPWPIRASSIASTDLTRSRDVHDLIRGAAREHDDRHGRPRRAASRCSRRRTSRSRAERRVDTRARPRLREPSDDPPLRVSQLRGGLRTTRRNDEPCRRRRSTRVRS